MTEAEIVDWLKNQDVELYTQSASVKDVMKRLEEETGGRLEEETGGRLSPRKFKRMREDACQYWKVHRNPRESKQECLSGEEWDRLRKAVLACSTKISGKGISVAVAIVGTLIRTNRTQLKGLPKRYHIWVSAGTAKSVASDGN